MILTYGKRLSLCCSIYLWVVAVIFFIYVSTVCINIREPACLSACRVDCQPFSLLSLHIYQLACLPNYQPASQPANCRHVTCHQLTCHLTTCHLTVCHLMVCHLLACHLQTCHLPACRSATHPACLLSVTLPANVPAGRSPDRIFCDVITSTAQTDTIATNCAEPAFYLVSNSFL